MKKLMTVMEYLQNPKCVIDILKVTSTRMGFCRVLVMLLLLAVSVSIEAQRCSRCGGRGKIQTRHSVGSYGINNRKVKCNYCGQWIYANESHWDDCPSCSGNRQNSSSSHRDKKIDRDAPVDVYAIYLSESEYADYQNAASMAIRGTKKEVACSQCRGTGKCYGCGGTGLSPIQVPSDAELGIPTYCGICAGDKKCSKCFGQRTMLVDSDEGKQEAVKKLQYYSKLVQERQAAATAQQNGLSSDNGEWGGNQDAEDLENEAEYQESQEYGDSGDGSLGLSENGSSTSSNILHNILLTCIRVLQWILDLGVFGILGIIVVGLILFNVIKGLF